MLLNCFKLARELKSPCKRMSGLAALKTRYRPFLCPLDLVLSQIPEGSRLYDIGCGTGALLYLASKFRSVRVAHGYDISPEAVRYSNAFKQDIQIGGSVGKVSPVDTPHFQVIHMQPEETPPDLASYDTVTMIDVLHHIPFEQQDNFLAKTIQSMEPGSRLIVKDIEASLRIGAFFNQLHDLLLSREWVYQRRSQDIRKVLQSTEASVSQPIIRWVLWYPHFLIVALIP